MIDLTIEINVGTRVNVSCVRVCLDINIEERLNSLINLACTDAYPTWYNHTTGNRMPYILQQSINKQPLKRGSTEDRIPTQRRSILLS